MGIKAIHGRARRPEGRPGPLRSFDPRKLGDLEYQAWVGYYLRDWRQVLTASVGLVRVGFGMDWTRTLHGAWLVLRANQVWAPYPDNNPEKARALMRRFYALVKLSYGKPENPAKAAELEVDWWRAHREAQHKTGPRSDEVADVGSTGGSGTGGSGTGGSDTGGYGADGYGTELVESLTRLYCYLYGEPEAAVRPAAVHRAHAMDLSDQWIDEGCQPDSPLLPLEHAALVRAYAALLAAVHH